jgi:hypothetical protein
MFTINDISTNRDHEVVEMGQGFSVPANITGTSYRKLVCNGHERKFYNIKAKKGKAIPVTGLEGP